MKRGCNPVRTIIARVMVAGVGQPVGVLEFACVLVIAPFVISSASILGVRSVFSGLGPAPDMPGTVEETKEGRFEGNVRFFREEWHTYQCVLYCARPV